VRLSQNNTVILRDFLAGIAEFHAQNGRFATAFLICIKGVNQFDKKTSYYLIYYNRSYYYDFLQCKGAEKI
jgi:hypothetical protein